MTASTSADPTLRGKTILIVEDHADSQAMLAWTFKSLGAKTLTAGNVSDAQKQILTHRPDLIISDLALPGASGFDLVAWLRGLPKEGGADTPCVGITAFSKAFPPPTSKGFNAWM